MTVTLPRDKIERFRDYPNFILSRNHCKIREVARLPGLTSYTTAMRFGRLFTHHLDIQKIDALKEADGNYDGKMTLDVTPRDDINWWITHLDSEFAYIKTAKPSVTLCTDISHDGWGGGHIVGGSSAGGKWKVIESDFHIKYLELLAVLYALRSFFKTEHGLHVRICSDNSCAVAYINHMGGGTHSRKLNFLARCIWVWCVRHNFWLTASHIPGPDNVIADFFSRNFKEDIQWCLNREVFLEICNRFGEPDLDLFASRLNRQTLNFVSWFPDPEALMTDALSFSWAPFFSYGFPPFCLLEQTSSKNKI